MNELSKREYIAAMMLQAIVARKSEPLADAHAHVSDAIELADMLLIGFAIHGRDA